jgi:hypothetical protein
MLALGVTATCFLTWQLALQLNGSLFFAPKMSLLSAAT